MGLATRPEDDAFDAIASEFGSYPSLSRIRSARAMNWKGLSHSYLRFLPSTIKEALTLLHSEPFDYVTSDEEKEEAAKELVEWSREVSEHLSRITLS